jgi:type VI secretion system protein VasG
MDIDIRTLLTRLNPECKHAMNVAAQMCVNQTHFNVEVEHLLLAMLEGPMPDLKLIFDEHTVNSDALTAQLQKTLEGFKRGNARTPALSPNFAPLLQEAWLMSSMLLAQQQVRSGTLLLAMLEETTIRGVLLESAPLLLDIPREQLRKALPQLLADSSEAATAAVATPRPRSASAAGTGEMPSQQASRAGTPALDKYTVDMTELARQGRIDPIRGRDAEVRQIIDILLRRRQNNPILTGEAGVGKTAVVEGFASRVVEGRVPPALSDVVVRSLDLGLLQAGAGIKGEFENRLNDVISEVRGAIHPIILFIDEAHQLIGAGGQEGHSDAANLLKPALARGELRTIAATTWLEYKKYVERDPALARRFQVVKVEEPSAEVAVDMLRGVKDMLERHHGVEILDQALEDAVRFSQRYISGRQLPDKAISVLDTACARVAVGLSGEPWLIELARADLRAALERLKLLRHRHGKGEELTQDIAQKTLQVKGIEERLSGLLEKLKAERDAAQEIRTLRQQIAFNTDSNTGLADDERAVMADQLKRLNSGFDAIQDDAPMVPLFVDGKVVADVISAWTGIPIGRMMTDEVHTVLHLKDRLKSRVIGQDDGLDAIARRVRTFRAQLDDPGKPVGVFMLVGPSGVGKTETAMALADMLYGGEKNVITINMSEYQEAHTVSSLKGAPPGYVGYGKGGILTEAVRQRPYSVVLLDEVEKAHPDVIELFFQVFDKGAMEDGDGVSIDFKNTLIILTSNASQDVVVQACARGQQPDSDTVLAALRPHLQAQFSPAFLGRLVIVPYFPLGDLQIRSIVDLKLEKLANRFDDNHSAVFTWDEQVADLITERCVEVDSGARNIDYILTHHVLPTLSTLVLERISIHKPFTSVHMYVDEQGLFAFAFKNQVLKGHL